jgi:Leucine-rich repeat (LRR) protein
MSEPRKKPGVAFWRPWWCSSRWPHIRFRPAHGVDPDITDSRRFFVLLPQPPWSRLLAVVLVIFSVGTRIGLPLYRQAIAIREVERLGGTASIRPWGPEWLRKRFGNSWTKLAGEVVSVDLQVKPASDGTLHHVRCLSGLEALTLNGTQITDAGLLHIGDMSNLRLLSLSFTQVTDDGLAHLKGLTSLTECFLDSTKVTDAGLLHLAGLKRLRGLSLDDTRVTNAGLAHLGDFAALEDLELKGTQVTDVGLVHLKGIHNLHVLVLDGTQVTDSGLVHLSELGNLRELWLNNTKVTEAGVAKLRRSLPKCRIVQ